MAIDINPLLYIRYSYKECDSTMKHNRLNFRRWFAQSVILFLAVYFSANLLLDSLLLHSRAPITCLLQRGTWERGICRYRTGDSGEPCRSSWECQTWCISEEARERHIPMGAEAEGVCYGWTTPKFCLTFIDYGIVIERRCF